MIESCSSRALIPFFFEFLPVCVLLCRRCCLNLSRRLESIPSYVCF